MQDSLYQNYASRPKRGCHFHLLAEGTTNPKLAKLAKLAEELGILPFALSLAPFTVSGAGNVCPFASAGCSAVYLNYAGRGRMSHVQQARVEKTRFWFADRQGFLELLKADLAKDDTTGFVREDCAIYARLSTTDQSTEPQLLDLRAYVKARGWNLYRGNT